MWHASGCPTSPPLSPVGPRMSSMFGKPRAGGERPAQSPLSECNVAILGCRGAGKSGEMGAQVPRQWPGVAGGERERRGGCARVVMPWRGHPPHPSLLPPAALTVKFLTKRFISEYDPNLGKMPSLRVFSWVVLHELPQSILPTSQLSHEHGI